MLYSEAANRWAAPSLAKSLRNAKMMSVEWGNGVWIWMQLSGCVGLLKKCLLTDGWMLTKTLAPSYSSVLELSHTGGSSLMTSLWPPAFRKHLLLRWGTAASKESELWSVCVCVCVFGGIRRGRVLVMDVFLFLFVVSQECSFSHAVRRTHTLTRRRGSAFSVHAVGEKHSQEEREEGDERAAGVNLIPLAPNDMPKTHSGGLESLLSQILYSPVLT